MIYMDNAATTMRKPKEVAEAVMHAMNSMGNAGRGANEASLSAARVIYDTRELLADFFDAENPKQIVFTSNSTESLNIAIKGILNPKDHAITTMLEHNSVLRPLYEMEERGSNLPESLFYPTLLQAVSCIFSSQHQTENLHGAR